MSRIIYLAGQFCKLRKGGKPEAERPKLTGRYLGVYFDYGAGVRQVYRGVNFSREGSSLTAEDKRINSYQSYLVGVVMAAVDPKKGG